MNKTYAVTITRRLDPERWGSIHFYLRMMSWRDRPEEMSAQEHEQEQEAYELCSLNGDVLLLQRQDGKLARKLERLIRLAPPVKKRVYQEFYDLLKAGGWLD